MPKCATCNTTILFGGVKEGGQRYCNDRCAGPARVLAAYDVPQDLIDSYAKELHDGRCPRCEGNGPVDVHRSHMVFSLVLITSWYSTPAVCCRRCARKRQLLAAVGSSLVGWWGFPFGVIITPVQILRNFAAMVGGPDPGTVSDELAQVARLHLVAELMAQDQIHPPAEQAVGA